MPALGGRSAGLGCGRLGASVSHTASVAMPCGNRIWSRNVRLGLSAILVCLTVLIGSQVADARFRDCGYAQGGSFRNVTSRNVPCREALRVARSVVRDIRPCWKTERRHRICYFWRRGWRVRAPWYRNRQGFWQLDMRATASRGRVVRFQTDFDNE